MGAVRIGKERRQWDGAGTPEAFVVSMNLHRRHLNESQGAMIAGRLATAKRLTLHLNPSILSSLL